MAHVNVVGRFAPSPSGPLHFGSVTAAVASYLNARARSGRWLLRIDDLDPPREQAGAASLIIATLDALGLQWDGEIVYQSRRSEAYNAALERLNHGHWTFPCACTRRELGGRRYPGTCRRGIAAHRTARAVRVCVGDETIAFDDAVQGRYAQNISQECGDFVVRRADSLVAYHLAVVVDDAAARVTEVVRGLDLIYSTPRQIYLQRLLGLSHPDYAHLPLVLGANGVKLSKQTHAAAILPQHAPVALFNALTFFGFEPPRELDGAPPAELLTWALAQWQLSAVKMHSRVYSVPFAAANIARNSS